MHPRIERALESFDASCNPWVIPDSLPTLDAISGIPGYKGRFEKYDALFIQHHLASLVPEVKAMASCGLDLQRAWFVDIPYSTSREVVDRLKTGMANPRQMSKAFNDPLADYAHAQSARVAFMLQGMMERPRPRPLLVIDDGAYFLRFLLDLSYHAPHLLSHFKHGCVVEQTTRGHRFIERYGPSLAEACELSIVSIAQCGTKTCFEGPFIGANITRSMLRSLGTARLESARKVAVLGYGTVGKGAVARILEQCPEAIIHVVDPNRERLEERGLPSPKVLRLERLGEHRDYDIVIGCTGTNSFLVEDRQLLSQDSALVSGSSAALEFNRFGFVELADRFVDDDIEILNREEILRCGIHAPISIRFENDKVLTLLNAGFPANFDGCGVESLPYSIIQATHSLLFAAATEATTAARPGFKALTKAMDELIFNLAIENLDS